MRFRWPFLAGLLLAGGCDSDRTEHEKDRVPPAPAPLAELRTRGGPVIAPPPLISEHAAQLPDSGFAHDEGLERLDWRVSDDGNPAQVYRLERVQPNSKRGTSTRLAVELLGGPHYYTALALAGRWSLSVASGAESVLSIYSDAPAALQVGLAFSLSETGVWHESRLFTLKPGWNTIRIPQHSSDFKTEASQWQHTSRLQRPQDCRAVTLLIHNGQRTGRLFIDYIAIAP